VEDAPSGKAPDRSLFAAAKRAAGFTETPGRVGSMSLIGEILWLQQSCEFACKRAVGWLNSFEDDGM
jgi:hypothetical protein